MTTEELRKGAMQLLSARSHDEVIPIDDVAELLEELQVHQVELELQNEALRNAQSESDTLREQFTDLFFLAPISYLIIDSTGKILDLNIAATELIQHDKRFAVGAGITRYISFESRDNFYHMLNQLLDSEQMQSTELALRQKDTDKLRYVQVHAQSFRDNFQLKVRLTLTDISDRVESDELLKQSEDRFRRAIMEMPEPAIIHADDGEILLVNNRWTEFSGYTQTDIPDIKTWTTKAYGDASEKIEADIKSLHSIEKRRDEGDYIIRTKDGNTRIWEFSSSPLGHLPDGRRISMSVARDVTRRRKDEQYLKEREAFINAILNTTPTLIAVWNIEPMELKFINARVKTLLGYSSDELISMGADMVHQLVHPDDIASYANHFQKFLDATPDQPVFYSQEFRAKDKQGQWHWFISIDSVLTYHEDGTPKEITGAAMDVTDLVGARNEIQALNETLEQRVEERTKELRTVNNRLVAEIQQRQEAENRLRDSEQFLQSIIDGQPSEIAVLDSSGIDRSC